MSALASARIGIALALALTGCGKRPIRESVVPGGNAERGRLAIETYGCGACHTIPGVRTARGLVGPPLGEVGRRVFIAGVLPNEPVNMIRWLVNPPAVDSRTAMPDLGVTEPVARDIAEYLYAVSGGAR